MHADDYPYVFAWGNNAVRAAWKGRRCRIVASGSRGTAMLEFEDGRRVVTSRRAVRRKGNQKSKIKEQNGGADEEKRWAQPTLRGQSKREAKSKGYHE